MWKNNNKVFLPKPLGAELILTQDISVPYTSLNRSDGTAQANSLLCGKDGQTFVRLRRSLEESRLEAGVKLKW